MACTFVLDMHVHVMHIVRMTLAEFMTARGLKDDDLTGPLGVGRSMVTKLRQRKTKPSYDVMQKLDALAKGAITVPEMAPINAPEPAESASAAQEAIA